MNSFSSGPENNHSSNTRRGPPLDIRREGIFVKRLRRLKRSGDRQQDTAQFLTELDCHFANIAFPPLSEKVRGFHREQKCASTFPRVPVRIPGITGGHVET